MNITAEMIEAGAKAIAPGVWTADPIFEKEPPDSLNRRGHEMCKNIARAQAEGCLRAALALTDGVLNHEEIAQLKSDKETLATGRQTDIPGSDPSVLYTMEEAEPHIEGYSLSNGHRA